MTARTGGTTRSHTAHVFVDSTWGTVIVRPGGLEDRMIIAACMSSAGHPTTWSHPYRDYEVTGGTWPDVEAVLSVYGVEARPSRFLRAARAR